MVRAPAYGSSGQVSSPQVYAAVSKKVAPVIRDA